MNILQFTERLEGARASTDAPLGRPRAQRFRPEIGGGHAAYPASPPVFGPEPSDRAFFKDASATFPTRRPPASLAPIRRAPQRFGRELANLTPVGVLAGGREARAFVRPNQTGRIL